MLQGYQVMPTAELLQATPVVLRVSVASLVSRAGARAVCVECGEEIVNERELHVEGRVLCRTCAEGGYYAPSPAPAHAAAHLKP
jgi:formylmethanofuran dehydrogenase subunit E